jgi:Tfp pilus assembly protein PilN
VKRRPPTIALYFASTDHALVARVRSMLLGAAVALGVLAVFLLLLGAFYRSRTAEIAKQVASLKSSEETVRSAMQERERLVRNLGEMSSLVDARRFGWTRLLTAIEKGFPSGVALSKLQYDPREHTVSLEGTAHSPEALSSLMIGLQRTEILKNPQLKRQSLEKGTLSFHVTVNYQ